MLNNNLSITSLLTLKHTNGTNRTISYPLHHRPNWTHSVLLSLFIIIIYCFSSQRKADETNMRFRWTCLRRRRPGAFDTRSFLYGIVIASLPFLAYFLLGPHFTSSSVPANLFTRKQSRLDLVASVSSVPAELFTRKQSRLDLVASVLTVPPELFTRKQSRLDLVAASVSKELSSLPTCPYNPSFLIRGTIARYSGWWRIKESLVFPRDDTDMLSRGSPWHWFQPSPLADRKKVSVVVNKLLTYFKSRYEVDSL